MKKKMILGITLFFVGCTVLAQEGSTSLEATNPNSVRGVHPSDIMWKKRVVRAMDLREKQNQPLFAKNKELTRIIIDAVKKGELTPYASDSLDAGNTVSLAAFLEKLTIPNNEITEDPDYVQTVSDVGGWSDFDIETDESIIEEPIETVSTVEYYLPRDIYQLELTEDLVFDKQRSQMRYDIQSLTIFIPADHPLNEKGIQDAVATFSYKDLHKLFKNQPSKAVWYNPANDSEHKNLADAFDLRLFSSYLIKVSNPGDDYLVDTYGGDEFTGIMASQWTTFELLEFEHNLWEF